MTHLLLHKTPNLVSSEPGAAQKAVGKNKTAKKVAKKKKAKKSKRS
jgi:hypothetical protein